MTRDAIAQMSHAWTQLVGYGYGDWYEGAREDKSVTADKALSYAPIWYGVNKIAGHIAQLPIGVFEKKDKRAERDRDHNVHKLMRRPNAYQSSIIFREQIAIHSLLEGNGRAAIVRRGNRVMELIPLDPNRTVTGMISGMKLHGTRPVADDRLRLFFPNYNPKDTSEEGFILLEDDDVLHIPGLSYNGVDGIALRKVAQRNIGASIHAEQRLAKQMEQGFSGNLMLEVPNNVFRNQKEAEEFLEHFEKRHNSPDKAGKPGMLREGIKANLLSTTNKDAEMIENRRFQRQDAALYLGLESILGDDSSVSYNSLEQKNLAYLMNTLNRWLKRWEEEMEYKLLPTRQFNDETHFIRFNTAALLKSDFKTAIEALSLAVSGTIFSPNEAREKLDMNPYPGGDVFRNPAPGGAPSTDQPKEPKPEKATQAHISHLIGVEANRVKDGAKKAENFLQWMDNFYSKNWLPNFADNLEAVGMDRDAATVHCEESKRRLLEVCDFSTPTNLAENVAKCVSNWKARANQIGVDNVQL